LYTCTVLRLGYPAQNLTLPATTNSTLRLASVSDVEKLQRLVRGNTADLRAILRWNAEHGIPLFRMGQDVIPFASHPAFTFEAKGKERALAPLVVEIE
jgi:UV DNA damage endonuclease